MNPAISELLFAASAAAYELERLHAVHIEVFRGKIGEPDIAKAERLRAAVAAVWKETP